MPKAQSIFEGDRGPAGVNFNGRRKAAYSATWRRGAARTVSRGWVVRSVLISLLTWLAGPTPAAAHALAVRRAGVHATRHKADHAKSHILFMGDRRAVNARHIHR